MKSWKRPRRGLTLVEVLTATIILSALMAAFLKVSRELRRQNQRAYQTLRATREMDQRILTWLTSEEGIPRNSAGALTTLPQGVWRTTIISHAREGRPWDIVRVQIVARDGQSDSTEQVLFSIDLMERGVSNQIASMEGP